MKNFTKVLLGWGLFILTILSNTLFAQVITTPTLVSTTNPVTLNYTVSGALIKTVTFDLSITTGYASLSLYANDKLLVDAIDIPSSGSHNLEMVVEFDAPGDVDLKLLSRSQDITVNTMGFTDNSDINLPIFADISESIGLDRDKLIKYGGPSIADVDNDGDYDFMTVNHNVFHSNLYWNNGDKTVTVHETSFTRWRLEDLHGASMGDYDNDGDLDIVFTKGGGNGENPTLPDFYTNENGKFIISQYDVGIYKGARGRGARWIDMDLDGDLDLVLFNAKGIAGEVPQHFFYRNIGNGGFELVSVPGIENFNSDRVIVTDFNGDHIDDILLYGWKCALYKGNGDFTFTDVSSQIPSSVRNLTDIMAAANIDIDNDGDIDFYLARGNAFAIGNNPTFDFDPLEKQMDIRTRHYSTSLVTLQADGDITFKNYGYATRNKFDPTGDNFPIYLGSTKTIKHIEMGDELTFTQAQADGWPDETSDNGIYIGHIGGGEWKTALKLNGQIFWNVGYSISGVNEAVPAFTAENNNRNDVLLRNDGVSFTDVSDEWNIPQSGNHSGVSAGDFNNDGFTDLLLHRWGFLSSKPSDYILINNGTSFENTTIHGASDPDDEGHGDMGQAFDFDLDGDLDMLNGSDDEGMWYLYDNTNPDNGNYALVRVGYAPHSNVDPISAEVIVKTPNKVYKKRVESAGAVYSQSLLNIVHFGLGDETTIDSIKIRWRDGETVVITDKAANQLFYTDDVDPTSITLLPETLDIREGTDYELEIQIEPINANKDITWNSNDDGIISVTQQNGWISAEGSVGQTAKITATSQKNGMYDTSIVTIVDWYSIPAETVTIYPDVDTIIEGDTIVLTATVLPKYNDNDTVIWSSSNTGIATVVDTTGKVTAITEGSVDIITTSVFDTTIKDTCKLVVRPRIPASITFDDDSVYLDAERYYTGDSMVVTTNYHAGSGQIVKAGDLGGISYLLRHMSSDWNTVIKDYGVIDRTVLRTESGTSAVIIPLTDVTPSAQLQNDEFYFLFVRVTSSDGKVYDKGLSPIIINPAKVSSILEETKVDENAEIQIYPNPAKNEIAFSNLSDKTYSVRILDMQGREYLYRQITGNSPISIQLLPTGMYSVLIENDGEFKVLNFIKE